jgi:hypothetical protein
MRTGTNPVRINWPEKEHLETRAPAMLMAFVISQVVNVSRLEGEDNPVQLIYFVEDQDGERLSAVKSSDLINKIDLQRAAIILGYRIQGAIAQRKSGRCIIWAVLRSKASHVLTVSSTFAVF